MVRIHPGSPNYRRIREHIIDICGFTASESIRILLIPFIGNTMIFFERNNWYWWDECGLEKHGPFTSYKRAKQALLDYSKSL